MNALDQAFIKAFAKDRTTSASQRAPSTRRVTIQPPEQGVESASLVLHEVYHQGRRLRIDRPISDVVSLTAHMVLPIVEHVESYQPEDVAGATALQVLFEDRLTPLEELKTAASALHPQADPAASKPARVSVTESNLADEQGETEPNVTARTDALEDMEVPALAHSEGDGSRPSVSAAAPQPAEDADEVGVEGLWLAHCQPRVLFAASESCAPELITREFGLLATPGAPQLDASLSALDVRLADVDPAWWEDPAARALPSGTNDALHDQPPGAPSAGQFPTAAQTSGEDAGESPAAGRPAAVFGDGSVGDDACGGMTADAAGPTLESAAIGATPGADLTAGPASLRAFAPAWEVDAFRWPELCQQLDEQTSGKLTQSGEELFVATGDGLKVLVVTSSVRHEGRTTLALSLARTAALAGSRVALVDADSGNPELARSLGLEAPCDWHDVLSQQQSLEEAAVMSAEDHVTLFPLTCPSDDFSGVVNRMLTRTLHELSRCFDLIVVDLPPFPSQSGMDRPADTICPIDMAVVVRHVQVTPQDEALATVSALRKLGVRAVGIIENFAPCESAVVNE